jgi:hypothetical protein
MYRFTQAMDNLTYSYTTSTNRPLRSGVSLRAPRVSCPKLNGRRGVPRRRLHWEVITSPTATRPAPLRSGVSFRTPRLSCPNLNGRRGVPRRRLHWEETAATTNTNMPLPTTRAIRGYCLPALRPRPHPLQPRLRAMPATTQTCLAT